MHCHHILQQGSLARVQRKSSLLRNPPSRCNVKLAKNGQTIDKAPIFSRPNPLLGKVLKTIFNASPSETLSWILVGYQTGLTFLLILASPRWTKSFLIRFCQNFPKLSAENKMHIVTASASALMESVCVCFGVIWQFPLNWWAKWGGALNCDDHVGGGAEIRGRTERELRGNTWWLITLPCIVFICLPWISNNVLLKWLQSSVERWIMIHSDGASCHINASYQT